MIRLHRSSKATAHRSNVLAETARSIASPQIRAMATVAGNLCQAKRCWFYRNDFACSSGAAGTCPVLRGHGRQPLPPRRRWRASMSGRDAKRPGDHAGRPRRRGDRPRTARQTAQRADGRLLFRARRNDPSRRRTSRGDRGRRSAGVDPCRVREAQAVGGRLRHRQRRRRPATRRRGRAIRRGLCRRDPSRHPSGWAVWRAPSWEHRRTSTRYDESSTRTWSSIAHPLANNEWKLDAATGVVTTAISRALGVGSEPSVAAQRRRWSAS